MARIHAFEFEDQEWFPRTVRDAMTGWLRLSAQVAGHGKAMAPVLAGLLRRAHETRIVDLCSGSGGPLPEVVELLHAEGIEASVTFTDLYPGDPFAEREAGAERGRLAKDPRFRFETDSVDATDVPSHLPGVRTLVNGFHHFRPEQARRILQDAADAGAPIAIFEFVGRHPLFLLVILFAPINVLLAIPFVRPFRWSWLPLTYLIPVIPLLTLWDGLVSCLRVYDEGELLALCDGIADPQRYRFEIEEFRVAPLPIAFRALVGCPLELAEGRQAVGASS